MAISQLGLPDSAENPEVRAEEWVHAATRGPRQCGWPPAARPPVLRGRGVTTFPATRVLPVASRRSLSTRTVQCLSVSTSMARRAVSVSQYVHGSAKGLTSQTQLRPNCWHSRVTQRGAARASRPGARHRGGRAGSAPGSFRSRLLPLCPRPRSRARRSSPFFVPTVFARLALSRG